MPFANRQNKHVVATVLIGAALLSAHGAVFAHAATQEDAKPAVAAAQSTLSAELTARESQVASRNQERTALSVETGTVQKSSLLGTSDFSSMTLSQQMNAEREISRKLAAQKVIADAQRAEAEAIAAAEAQRIAEEEAARQAAADQAAREAAEKAEAERKAAEEKAAAEAKAKADAEAQAAKEAKAAKAAEEKAAAASKKPSKSSEPAPESASAPINSGDPRGIARDMMAADYGWGSDQFSCLDKLWEKESNWRVTADNPSSSAYGIPQALPGSKMSSAGSDWKTNPATQIKWGLTYIDGRYGTPCSAWGHSQKKGWY